MKGIVNGVQRLAKMRAHTATHLLHAYLGRIFPDTRQAGSLVEQDYLRFDFYSDRILNFQEVQDLQKQMNFWIEEKNKIEIEQMPYEQAISMGAKAFFQDKYGEIVRVVSIIDFKTKKPISVELCGGTHVACTSEIGAFSVIHQEAVASGIKRISAYTGPKVGLYLLQLNDRFNEIASMLDCDVKQIIERTEKRQKEYDSLCQRLQSLQDCVLDEKIMTLCGENKLGIKPFDVILDISNDLFLTNLPMKQIADCIKKHYPTLLFAIFNKNGNYLIACPEGGVSAREIQKKLGLQGGGHDLLVQGKDSEFIKKLESASW